MKFLMPLLIIVFTYCPFLNAQYKYEKEYRVSVRSIPENALDFISKINFNSKVKWFKEEGFNKTTVEAKTKHLGYKYSIEFNLNGIIEDVEHDLKWKDIPEALRVEICNVFNTDHDNYWIEKIQIQYTGPSNDLIDKIRDPKIKNDLTEKYELVIKAKTSNKIAMMEYLFALNGDVEKRSKILSKSTDNLEF